MNKKIISVSLLFTVLLFSSCWIYPDYKDYEVIDEIYYFKDYETMKSVIIPMINTSFTAWHWSDEEFDKKYDKYFGNMDANEDDFAVLTEKGYKFAVRNKKSTSNLTTKEGKRISAEYYWITTKDGEAVIFYQT